jgi:hypothetical protein
VARGPLIDTPVVVRRRVVGNQQLALAELCRLLKNKLITVGESWMLEATSRSKICWMYSSLMSESNIESTRSQT